MSVSDKNKQIAKLALDAFGGKPTVFNYLDDNNSSSVDVLSSQNRPYEKVTSISTIGLSDYSIGLFVEGIPLRVELVGAYATEFDRFPNVLATCALCVINSNYKCYPGAIFHDTVKMYYPQYVMKHVLLTTPFVWEEELETVHFPDMTVEWLLAVPISEQEYRYTLEKSVDALEDLFVEEQIDMFDIGRKSVL